MVTTPEYYQKNREKLLKQARERYKVNREYLLKYQQEYRKKNREKLNKKSRTKRYTRLLEFIQILGGKCNNCGGIFDPICYDFHHINPNEKDFTIGENMLLGKEKMLAEVRKCTLLCANCHRLIHKQYGKESI